MKKKNVDIYLTFFSMSNFTKNINILRKELKSIKNINDIKIDQIDYKTLYEESEEKLKSVSDSVDKLNTTLDNVKGEYELLKSNMEKMKKNNESLRLTNINLSKELENLKISNENLTITNKDIEEGISFWREQCGDIENQYLIEKNNHGKTKLKVKNMIDYCDEIKMNFELKKQELKNMRNQCDKMKLNYELETRDLEHKLNSLEKNILKIIG